MLLNDLFKIAGEDGSIPQCIQLVVNAGLQAKYAVLIPASYTGTESFSNPTNVPIIDLRISGTGLGGILSAVKPQFGRYLFSVTNGIVSAQNLLTGNIDYSGPDAAIVINSVLAAMASTGGQLFFQDGIYNIESMTQETASGWTSFYYGIGIPAAAEGSLVQWHFTGETRTTWLGESGSSAIQTNGVIFNVTPGAIAGISGADTCCAIWQRPATTPFTGEDYFKNLCVRFPTNTRGNEIGICVYNAWTVDYDNVMADFDLAYSVIAAGSLPASGSFGLTSTYSSSSNLQHFKDTYAVGYQYGYDMQSEHVVADTITSIYCQYAGIFGRSGTAIYHPCVMVHVTDQECANGWQFGSEMVLGSRIDIIGLDIEYLTSGTFQRNAASMAEVNAGYTSGMIRATVVQAGLGVVNSGALFAAGSGINFDVQVSGKIYPEGLLTSSTASATTTGTIKQTLASFSISGGPQSGEGSLFINNKGAVVRIKAWGVTAANGNSKVVEIDFGGTAIASITSTVNNGAIELEADIICGANNVQECIGKCDDGTTRTVIRTAPGITATAAIIIALAATTASQAGDFTFTGWTIELLGGSH